MSKVILLATEKPFSPRARDELLSIVRSVGYEGRALEGYRDKAELCAALADVDALVVRSDVVDAEVLDAGKRLALVVRAGAGVDTIDVEAARARGVAVMNTPGQNANAVAELAIGLMIYSARGHFGGATGTELRGKTLGLHAYGWVAKATGRVGAALGMRVAAFDPFVAAGVIEADGVTRLGTIEELYATSDVVSLHVPATASTKKSVGRALLSRMPLGACLVNTARREIVDEEGLVAALEERADLRYVADVEPGEPARTILRERFGARVYWTPKKMGAQTVEANVNAGLAAARQALRFFEEGDRSYVVNDPPR